MLEYAEDDGLSRDVVLRWESEDTHSSESQEKNL